jgi:hypothetical protein
LSDDLWMLFAAAEALFDGDETKARKQLLRALELGELRSRGVYLPDQKTWEDGCPRNDFAPEAIPADRWSTWEFLPVYPEQLSDQMRALQWLVPAGTLLSRFCRGYADVQLSRPDVEWFARAASLGASWISLLCSDGASETSETVPALAKSYFDEQRWPLRHALNWIACRKIEGLTLPPDELRSRRWQALIHKADADGLASVNPGYELLTALKVGKLRAISPTTTSCRPNTGTTDPSIRRPGETFAFDATTCFSCGRAVRRRQRTKPLAKAHLLARRAGRKFAPSRRNCRRVSRRAGRTEAQTKTRGHRQVTCRLKHAREPPR